MSSLPSRLWKAADHEKGLGTGMGTMAATGPIQGPKASPPSRRTIHEQGVKQTTEGLKLLVTRPSTWIGSSTTKLS